MSYIYSNDNKRYYTQNYYLKQRFGTKVTKISLDPGFTCPNRDGTKGYGGCTFCSDKRSGDFGGNPTNDLLTQFNDVKAVMDKKWHDTLYIAYLQAGTNTYAPYDTLKATYEKVLSFDKVVGLSIATRADCIDDNIIKLLKSINSKTYLTVELGLQSIYDKTALLTNRCHSYYDFLTGYKKLYDAGINVCIHIINGLPHETYDMMINTIKEVARLKPHSVKIHLLHIIKNTKLWESYMNGDFKAMEREDYIKLVCDQLEYLPPETVIQRLTGDGDRKTLEAPLWSIKKLGVLNDIDKEMARRNSYQGIKYSIII